MPSFNDNDYETIKQHLLDGNYETDGLIHLHTAYGGHMDRDTRVELIMELRQDPDVMNYMNSTGGDVNTIGGFGNGGIFVGGADQEPRTDAERIEIYTDKILGNEYDDGGVVDHNTPAYQPQNTQDSSDSISEESTTVVNNTTESSVPDVEPGVTTTLNGTDTLVLPDELPATGISGDAFINGNGEVLTPSDPIPDSMYDDYAALQDIHHGQVTQTISDYNEGTAETTIELPDVLPGGDPILNDPDFELLQQVASAQDLELGRSVLLAIDNSNSYVHEMVDALKEVNEDLKLEFLNNFFNTIDIVQAPIDNALPLYKEVLNMQLLISNQNQFSEVEQIQLMGKYIEDFVAHSKDILIQANLPGIHEDNWNYLMDILIPDPADWSAASHLRDTLNHLRGYDEFVEFAQIMQLPTDEALPALKAFAHRLGKGAIEDFSNWYDSRIEAAGAAIREFTYNGIQKAEDLLGFIRNGRS